MGFSIATLAVLAVFAASISAVELEDVFADTASTFEFIGGVEVDDALEISELPDKSDASDDSTLEYVGDSDDDDSTQEYIGDSEDDDSVDFDEFSLEANKVSSDLVVRDSNYLIENNFQFNRKNL